MNGDSWIATDERPRHQANRYRTAILNLLGDLVDDAPTFKAIRGVVVMPRFNNRHARALFATVGSIRTTTSSRCSGSTPPSPSRCSYLRDSANQPVARLVTQSPTR